MGIGILCLLVSFLGTLIRCGRVLMVMVLEVVGGVLVGLVMRDWGYLCMIYVYRDMLHGIGWWKWSFRISCHKDFHVEW